MEWNTNLARQIYHKYLGVTIDRTLSFNEHTRKVKVKIQSRYALLSKLANSKWGANPYTLRTTTSALCFSTAEYACPVWERSAHLNYSRSILKVPFLCLVAIDYSLFFKMDLTPNR